MICWDPSGNVVDSNVLPMITAMGSRLSSLGFEDLKGERLEMVEEGGVMPGFAFIVFLLLRVK